MAVYPLLSDEQVALGYASYCIFETCKQQWSVVIGVVVMDCHGSDWGLKIHSRYGYGRP